MIALFGGTFDPVHNGHLQTVHAVQRDCGFAQVRWVLSAQPPHRDQPSATSEQRMAMLNLALKDYPAMVSDDCEIRRSGPSYTVLTLEEFARRFPTCSVTLIVGADVLQSLHTWHQSERLLALANILVMHRPGYSASVPRWLRPAVVDTVAALHQQHAGAVMVCEVPLLPVSATQIRQRCAARQPVDDLVPEAVADYINQHSLYQTLNHKRTYEGRTA